jgi:ketosteroid isomerase-like protein
VSARSLKVAALCLAVLPLFALAYQKASDNAQAIATADRAFCQSTRARGLDGWVDAFADNAVLGQFDPPAKGKDAIRQAYAGLFARKDLDFQWEPDSSAAFPQGNLGFSFGHYRMRFTDAKGVAQTRTGNYLTVWEKQKDGAWKVIADFGSQDPPAK